MFKSQNIIFLLLLIFSVSVLAEDIEIYVNHDVAKTEKSRVVVLFDTSGSMSWDSEDGMQCHEKQKNWWGGTKYQWVDCFDTTKTSKKCYKRSGHSYYKTQCKDSRMRVAKAAMKKLVEDNSDFDFGLMRFYSSNGGYVLAGLGMERDTVVSKINNLYSSGATPITETLWEAYLYLTGRAPDQAAGRRDRDSSIESSGKYISPFKPISGEPLRCDNSINMILMTDGDPTGDSNRNSQIISEYKRVFGSSPSLENGSYMGSLARLMRGTDETAVDLYPGTSTKKDFARVFTIGFGKGMSNNGKKLLQNTATHGGGKYVHADGADDLVKSLNETISTIREINDSFASPAVSTNSADRTTHRDSLYYTMFLPKTHARWKGNLKKLKLGSDGIKDMSGKLAMDEEGGVIGKDATTFWSAPGSKDGNNIQEGGVNYQLSKQITRKLYSDFGLGTLIEFNYDKISQRLNEEQLAGRFGTNNASETKKLMKWAAGEDVLGENSSSTRRADIFGDPLHSKPVTMDYGNDDVRVFIGTNAGVLHAFRDNDKTVEESWAFYPGSLLDIHKPQMEKQQDTKVYGVDGPLNVFFKDLNRDGVVNGNDKVWLFAGLRRGGDEYYGIDITNPDTPKLMWGGPISPSRTGFEELGQTWSKPLVTHIRMQKDKPVLIFGAGYDTNKDNVARTDDNQGRGIFIVDAETGKLVWSLTSRNKSNKFSGSHSIAADLAIMDSDYDGFTDRIYAADTAGDIWRIDMPRDLPNDADAPWTHFKFASLGSSKSNQDRRFFYQPLVARTYFSKVTINQSSGNTNKTITRKDTPYEAILIGSGDRTSPLSTQVDDYLFMLRDENTVTQSFSKNVPKTIVMSDLLDVEYDPFSNVTSKDEFYEVEANLAKEKGWKYKLRSGEKSLAKATVIGGVAYFTSFMPASLSSANQCSLSGGSGSLYALHMHYGSRVFERSRYDTARDLPDTPTIIYPDSNDSGRSEGKIITELKNVTTGSNTCEGPGKSEPGKGFKPIAIRGPIPTLDEKGKIDCPPEDSVGMTTRQMYIYKREEHDEK